MPSSVADCDAATRLFENAFDELCGWLFNLLEDGSLVPMVEIATQYELILKRRSEVCTESMLRTAHIRDRLEVRFERELHFEKRSNYEVRIDTFLLPSLVFLHCRVPSSRCQTSQATSAWRCRHLMFGLGRQRTIPGANRKSANP